MPEDGDVTSGESGAESSDDYSHEIDALTAADEYAAHIEISEPARIAWSLAATDVMSELDESDKAAVHAAIDGKLSTFDGDDGTKLGDGHFMVLEVNDHLRVIYSKRPARQRSDDHPGYSILTVARKPHQMFRFTQYALGR